MQEITDWLTRLGLSEYAGAFAENGIDVSVLPHLTDQDLKDVGVLLGHRRKILAAVAELPGKSPSASKPFPPVVEARDRHTTEPPQPAPVAPPPTEAIGERRHVTVMFCDLVDSTVIAAKLDAEEWRDLVGAYIDAASAAVVEMGGKVAKKLGDGLLALFGYPVAQENDAERAARAALSIQRALAELNRKNAGSGKPELAARIGLDTGPAVVDAAGEIFGDVVNVAARVQALAEPGAVLITARVQRQMVGLFVAEERGTHPLKGVREPTALYRLVRASGGGRRSERRLTPLVGREDEMTTLMRRWQRVRQGEGQLVLIVGEPGLGKSRLIEEFHSRLADTPHTWVEWSCSQLLQNTPLHPIAEWGRQRFGGADVPPEQRLAELESSLAQVKLDPAEMVPLLAPLLDMPLPRERMPALAPEELRRRQLAALTNWVMAGAKVQPLVLAFEDLHWADPTTLDVLRGIAERGALAPLLIVATTRPEFRVPWSMRSHHSTISLAPLDRVQVRDMVTELSARHALSKEVVEDVAARTGGVPLFVEEVTRLLLERGEQGGIHAIPPTLQQSLMARLDRLGPAREVAQVGSVIGRGFSYGLLRGVAGIAEAALRAALEKLAEADIVLVQGLPPESDYRFKHALIQDAAYENLLKSRRQLLHRRVAEILRDHFADTAAAEPEMLAHHFTQAGMTDAAIEWWGKAGDQALRRSAFQEAIAHLGKAIEMADNSAAAAPHTATPAGARVKLQTNFGAALIAARGDASPETTAAFARARELAAAVADPTERLSANYGLWVGSLSRGEVGPLRAIAEVVLRDIEGKPASLEVAVAHRLAGTTEWYLGNFELARAHVGQALAMFDPVRDRDQSYRFGRDVGVSAMVFSAFALWALGETDEARRIGEELLARAVVSGHMLTTVYGHFQCALLHVARRDAAATLPLAEAVVKLAREHDMTLYTAYGRFLHPWARWHLGDREGGLAAMRGGIAECQDMGNVLYTTLFETALAEAEAEAGEIDAALATIDHAVALTERTGQRWNEADTHRARGEILLKRDPANIAPAEEAFLTAIAIAQRQKARSFELRAALSLAKLYQSTGRPADAHAVLVPALEGFSPAPEFPEIAEAQTLLAALAETEEVKKAAAARRRRLKLQTDYGQAVMWSKGFLADETKVAFTRARELTAGTDNSAGRFIAYYAQWAGQLSHAELEFARETAETFRRQAENEGQATELVAGLRMLGLTCLFQGDFLAARAHLEEALKRYDPQRDHVATFRLGQDAGAAASTYLGFTNWLLGDVGDRRARMEEGIARGVETNHVTTQANIYCWTATFETLRGDVEGAQRAAHRVIALAREHGLKDFAVWGALSSAWASARLGDGETGVNEFREALQAYISQGNKGHLPLYQGQLAEFEAEGQDVDAALARIDAALSCARATGEHWTDAFLHRIRGEILLKRDPANTASAEEALLAAIEVAQQQKARSLGLRAALSLAKLYQSSGRAVEAYAVITPALAGFSPTPEFPEISEARALLEVLEQDETVKAAAGRRERRVQLQLAYGAALISARGYGAAETVKAFDRARELSAAVGGSVDRLALSYGIWLGAVTTESFEAGSKAAAALLADATQARDNGAIGVAHRALGATLLYGGLFREAKREFDEATSLLGTTDDTELALRFNGSPRAASLILRALAAWTTSDFDQAARDVQEAAAEAERADDAMTQGYIYGWTAIFGAVRRNVPLTSFGARHLLKLVADTGLRTWAPAAEQFDRWSRSMSGGEPFSVDILRAARPALKEVGHDKIVTPIIGVLAAEAEVRNGRPGEALALAEDLITDVRASGLRWQESELLRVRGEALLRGQPPNRERASRDLEAAIAVAREQGARAFELRTALSLAKLYQSTGLPLEAHGTLAQALEGFSPTPEFPEIGQAQALLAALT
jgi:class 3 adenylate cyclase/predicted ATPase